MIIGEAGYDDERFEFHAELDQRVAFFLDEFFMAQAGLERASPSSRPGAS